MDFSNLGLSSDLLRAVSDAGYTTPTAIQAEAIPEVLREWRTPSHDSFRERTAYSLLNAFTEILKGRFERYPHRAAYESINLQKLLCQDGSVLAC
jgi:hypothetical protein